MNKNPPRPGGQTLASQSVFLPVFLLGKTTISIRHPFSEALAESISYHLLVLATRGVSTISAGYKRSL